MSRTHAHTPLYVRAQRASDSAVVHYGCVHDDEHQPLGRIVGYSERSVTVPGHHGVREVRLHSGDRIPPRSKRVVEDVDFGDYTYKTGASDFFRCHGDRCSETDGVHREHSIFRIEGFIETYTEMTRTPIYRRVPCDAGSVGGFCYVDSDIESRKPSRREGCSCCQCDTRVDHGSDRTTLRSSLRAAADEYNTFGDVEDHEVIERPVRALFSW